MSSNDCAMCEQASAQVATVTAERDVARALLRAAGQTMPHTVLGDLIRAEIAKWNRELGREVVS